MSKATATFDPGPAGAYSSFPTIKIPDNSKSQANENI
jgi:hypothetical protein